MQVLWVRKGSGFTLLFEGFVLQLSQHQPVASIARMVASMILGCGVSLIIIQVRHAILKIIVMLIRFV